MVTKPANATERGLSWPTWSIVGALALATILLVIGLGVTSTRFGAEYAALGAAGLAAVLVVLALGIAGKGGYLAGIFLLSLLTALRLKLGGVTFYAFDPILAAMYLVWIGEIVAGRVRPPRMTLIGLVWLILLGWLLVGAFLAVDVTTSVNGWLFWVRIFLIYFYGAQRLGRRDVWGLVWLISLVALLEGGLGLVQFVTHTNVGSISDLVGGSVSVAREIQLGAGGTLFRVRGTLGYDTALAHWLELLIPILLSLLLVVKRATVRLWLLAGIVLGTATVVVTFTRGAWFGLVAGVTMVLLFNVRRILRHPRVLTIIVLALMLMLVAMIPFAHLIRERLVDTANDTVSVRTNLNRAALEIIPDYPLTGIGLDNFPRVAPNYRAGYDWLSEGAEHKVHDLYLALAVEGGIPALGLFLIIQGLALALGWVSRYDVQATALSLGISAGMIAVLVHGTVAWGLISYSVLPLWALLLGVLSAMSRLNRQAQPTEGAANAETSSAIV